MRRVPSILLVLAPVLLLTGCAAGSPDAGHALAQGSLAQIFLGLWHGIIAPVTLIIEIVNRLAPHVLPWTAHVYDTRNSSMEYDLGFVLGITGSPFLVVRSWRQQRA